MSGVFAAIRHEINVPAIKRMTNTRYTASGGSGVIKIIPPDMNTKIMPPNEQIIPDAPCFTTAAAFVHSKFGNLMLTVRPKTAIKILHKTDITTGSTAYSRSGRNRMDSKTDEIKIAGTVRHKFMMILAL